MSDELVNQNVDIFDRHSAVPTVVMDSGDIDFPSDKIQDNSYHGDYIATLYLINKGHTNIGVFVVQSTNQRLKNVTSVLNKRCWMQN